MFLPLRMQQYNTNKLDQGSLVLAGILPRSVADVRVHFLKTSSNGMDQSSNSHNINKVIRSSEALLGLTTA